jgi:hypothetical protein
VLTMGCLPCLHVSSAGHAWVGCPVDDADQLHSLHGVNPAMTVVELSPSLG